MLEALTEILLFTLFFSLFIAVVFSIIAIQDLMEGRFEKDWKQFLKENELQD